MDFVLLGKTTLEGLRKMLATLDNPGGDISCYITVEHALLIAEICKLAEDREDWFPVGKWATIQALQAHVEVEIKKLFEKQIKPEGKT